MTVAAVASLFVGLVIGFVAQRSRMCFIGGIRDYVLVRDTFLLKGLFSFLLVAWVAFPLFGLLGGEAIAGFGRPGIRALLLTAAGGFGVGYVSTLADGCPLRQHVLAAQGGIGSMYYLAGFLVGVPVFHGLVAPLIGDVLL